MSRLFLSFISEIKDGNARGRFPHVRGLVGVAALSLRAARTAAGASAVLRVTGMSSAAALTAPKHARLFAECALSWEDDARFSDSVCDVNASSMLRLSEKEEELDIVLSVSVAPRSGIVLDSFLFTE